MASQRIPQTYSPLVSLAGDAADGAATHGPAIGLVENTAEAILADLEALAGRAGIPSLSGLPGNFEVMPVAGMQPLYLAAKSRKTVVTASLRTIESNARAFCAAAIDTLRPRLGERRNGDPEAFGLEAGALAIPAGIAPLLAEIHAHFLQNPSHENPDAGITAAHSAAWREALAEARKASNESNTACGQAKLARDTAQARLHERLGNLVVELGRLLAPDDSRWYAFGFDRPADGDRPGPIANLVLTPGSAGMVLADWDDARRADRYRVYRQTPHESAPIAVANAVLESEYTLTGLPSGLVVRISIVPVNEAGSGPESTPAEILVP
jgi:hypothetical protein